MRSFVVDQLMGGTLIAALPIAIFAGLLSFLSPCVLPLVPGYIAYATGFASTKGRVLLGSLLFVLGFTFVFASFGLAFGGLGSQIAAHEEVLTKILGTFTVLMGLVFIGLFPFAPTFQPKISTTGGIAGAPLLGALFGIGWTPCIGPALATVQTLAVQKGSRISKIGGALLITIGLMQISGVWGDVMINLRSLISDFVPVI